MSHSTNYSSYNAQKGFVASMKGQCPSVKGAIATSPPDDKRLRRESSKKRTRNTESDRKGAGGENPKFH